MINRKRKNIIKKYSKPLKLPLCFCAFAFCLLSYLSAPFCWAVASKITRHTTAADLAKGKTEDVVVGSKGTLQLGRAAQVLVGDLEDVWSINSVVINKDTVYLGTSPNGGIYKYASGSITKIYPLEQKDAKDSESKHQDINKPSDANTEQQKQYLTNKHIFAMATDSTGRLLAAVSGSECKLMRLEAGKMKTIFEPNDAKYIFAVALDNKGNIYLGTGPQGKLYGLNPSGKKAQLIYDSRDKNILSLAAGRDGFIYAGTDDRGLIYKIDPRSKTATVLFDSDQPEITAILFADNGNLYAAATSAKIAQPPPESAPQMPFPGRPEPQEEDEEEKKKDEQEEQEEQQEQEKKSDAEGDQNLQIANTKQSAGNAPAEGAAPPAKPPRPSGASFIYKITKDGYVTDVFSQTAVFFCLASQQQNLLVGTGNSGRAFAVEPASEEETIIYEDKQASQITAVAVAAEDVYLGTANPPKLIKLAGGFASKGTYTSDLVDAGQPADWGKLQIESDIPQDCKVWVASRSGNVKDINDPAFSDWTAPVEITMPVQLQCPLGRFCQYRLVLESKDGRKSPVVREIAVASTVPNLAPKVDSVTVSRLTEQGKSGIFKIAYKTTDDNGDKLIYKIDFRKITRAAWLELEDDIEAEFFEWDSKTVEDGRYEIRITASDERSNSTTTALTGTRITEPVVVDNTAPAVTDYSIVSSGKTVTLKLAVSDKLSAIGKLDYTVDSNAEWKATVPDDLVYDTTDEEFTIVVEELDAGEHIIAIRLSDDVGNTLYRTFEVNITGG